MAESFAQLAGCLDGGGALGVDVAVHDGGGQADAQGAGVGADLVRIGPLRRRRDGRVARFVTGDGVEHHGGVAHRAGDDTVDGGAVPALAERRTLRDPGAAGLEPDEAAFARRDTDRSAAVVGVSDGDDAGGDRGGGPTAGSAGGVFEVPGVAGGSVDGGFGGDGRAELGDVGAPDGDEAESPEAAIQVGVVVFAEADGGQGGIALVVGFARHRAAEVLDDHGHAVERGVGGDAVGGVAGPVGEGTGERVGFGASMVEAFVDDGVEHGVEGLAPVDGVVDELAGRGVSRGDEAGLVDGIRWCGHARTLLRGGVLGPGRTPAGRARREDRRPGGRPDSGGKINAARPVVHSAFVHRRSGKGWSHGKVGSNRCGPGPALRAASPCPTNRSSPFPPVEPTARARPRPRARVAGAPRRHRRRRVADAPASRGVRSRFLTTRARPASEPSRKRESGV